MKDNNIFEDTKFQFEQFLTSVGNVLANEKEINTIQNKLRRHFNSTTLTYLSSPDFQSRFNHIRHAFNENNKSTKYFTLLASFDEQLKKNNIQKLEVHPSSNENTVTTSSTSITLRSSSPTTSQENISASTVEKTVDHLINSCSSFSLNLHRTELPITTDSINSSECGMKREKKILKLERRLSKLSKTIRQLEEKDMSLAEMEYCDLYHVESRLKKQACEVYKKLTELKKQSSSAERILDQPVSLTETDINHPLINKALEDMVNQTKFLPCFNDVLDIVEKVNDEHKLNFSPDDRKTLAQKSFQLIGKKVKSRRMADFNDIMKSRLPENFDIEQNDPALNDIELENTLVENEREAVAKTEKIFEEYSQKDPDLEPEINIESSDECVDQSDEEDEEVNCEVELVVEPFDTTHDETDKPYDNKTSDNDYDIADILPPISSKSSSPSLSVEDPVEVPIEISLHNRPITILSTASISLKRTTCESFTTVIEKNESNLYTILDDNDIKESQSISIIEEKKVQTLIPRRRRQTSRNGTLYDFFQQQFVENHTSNSSKRVSTSDTESSPQKKLKETPEVVILD